MLKVGNLDCLIFSVSLYDNNDRSIWAHGTLFNFADGSHFTIYHFPF